MKDKKVKLKNPKSKIIHVLICSIIIFGAAISSAQKEGTNSGGGGDSVIDPLTGKKKLLDLAEVDEWPKKIFIPVSQEYLKKFSEVLSADLESNSYLDDSSYFLSLKYYWSDRDLHPKIQVFAGIAGAGLTVTLSNRNAHYSNLKSKLLEVKHDEIITNLDQRIDKDGRIMKWIFVDFPLEEIDDEGAIRLSDISTKKQLAIQKNGVVAIQRQEFNQLDKDSQAEIFVHEAFLFSTLLIKPDFIAKDGTSNLRLFVKRLHDYRILFSKFTIDRNSVDDATLVYTYQSIEEAYKKLMNPNSKTKY